MDKKKTPTLPEVTTLPSKAEENTKIQLPTLNELFEGVDSIGKSEGLNALLNAQPPEKWIKEHPFIKGHRYMPIDKVEYLLRKIFKRFRIEITGQGTAFNGVWVTVRIHVFDPALMDWTFYDGIGGTQLQTSKGTSPADLSNINNGALSMAFPLAKSLAIKDACHNIGNIFGANLDRKDTLEFKPDEHLITKSREEIRKEKLIENGVAV